MSEETSHPHDVFLSHSSRDKKWADAACAVLERHRIRCWIAPRDITPGDEWGASIIKGINGSRMMVLIFSANANASSQVRREVDRAISQGMTVMPIRIENVRPEGAMEFALSNTHWLDAFTPPAERHLEMVARSVKTLLGHDLEEEGTSKRSEPQTLLPITLTRIDKGGSATRWGDGMAQRRASAASAGCGRHARCPRAWHSRLRGQQQPEAHQDRGGWHQRLLHQWRWPWNTGRQASGTDRWQLADQPADVLWSQAADSARRAETNPSGRTGTTPPYHRRRFVDRRGQPTRYPLSETAASCSATWGGATTT